MNRALFELFENHAGRVVISAIDRPIWCLWPADAAENHRATASDAFNAWDLGLAFVDTGGRIRWTALSAGWPASSPSGGRR
jgi:hypothetical protein